MKIILNGYKIASRIDRHEIRTNIHLVTILKISLYGFSQTLTLFNFMGYSIESHPNAKLLYSIFSPKHLPIIRCISVGERSNS